MRLFVLLGICTAQIVNENMFKINIVLTGLKKKIKQFEELFEQENGYKVRKKKLFSQKLLSAWLTYFCLYVIIVFYCISSESSLLPKYKFRGPQYIKG